MKKSFLVAFASLIFITGNSQIKFGVVAGMDGSNIATTRGITSDPVISFHGGFLIDLKLPSSNFHVEGQVLYTSFGYKNSNISAVDKGGDLLGDIGNERIGYMQVPILASYQFGSSRMNFRLGAGPYFSFETNETLKIAGGGDTFRKTVFPIYTTGRNSSIEGGEIFARLQLLKFFASIQYQRSFTNIYQNTDNNTTKWQIGNIGISLGVFLK